MTSAAVLFLATMLMNPQAPVGKPLPAGGASLFGPDPMAILTMHGDVQKGKLTKESGPRGISAVGETLSRPQNEWSLQLSLTTTEPVEAGDVVLVSFWMQAVKGQPETGEARTLMAFITGGPEWAQSATKSLNPGRNLEQVLVPFTIKHSRPAGQSLLVFDMGYSPQSFRISGVQALNYKKTKKLSELPITSTRYPGDEPDAAWRKAANERIKKLRMGDLTIKAMDAKGRPLPKAQIKVEMVKHQFPFGTALAANRLVSSDPQDVKYREMFLKNFNFAAIENHLKWPFWEEWGRPDGEKALDWLNRQGVPVRGHTIIWPGHDNLPKDFPSLAGKPAEMRARIEGRFQDIIGATKGKVVEWDVVNESYTNNDVMKTLGWGEMAAWFKRVKELDPKPRLTFNDYPPLDGGDPRNPHLNHFYTQIEALQKAKAPIEAIGFQCHMGSRPISPERLLKGLDRFSKFGIPIVVTEFDMETAESDLQARYMRDFMTALFSHPSVANITQWGFWQGSHWMPNAALWDNEWKIRPHGQVYLDLIHKQWSTKAAVSAKSDGSATVRAFYGTYNVTIQGKGGAKKTVKVSHLKGQKSVFQVKMD